MYAIRSATVADAPAIAEVHVESWRTAYAGILPAPLLAALDVEERSQMWREWLSSATSLVRVATQQGQVVGFAGGGVARDKALDCEGEIYALYLLPAAQRQGIGTALFRSLKEALLEAGLRSVAVWVLEANPARRFYEAHGGECAHAKRIEMGGAELVEVAYTWKSAAAPTSGTR